MIAPMDARRWLVAGNYYLTLPWRRWETRRTERAGRAPIMVLFYHRVADTHPNDWTISCELFARQIEWLRARVELISLRKAHQRLAHGENPRLAACITFDDGYAENCEFALPFLRESQVPCCYFVATQHILQGQPFPHDLEAGHPLPPNTPAQIQQMAAAGVEIGAHTRTHADLGRLQEPDELVDEIVGSRDDLAKLIGRPIDFFAFPYGQTSQLTPLAAQVARDAGFRAICSAYGGYNRPGVNPFHLQRIHGDPEMIRFRNWMSVDPRKWKLHPTCSFPSPEASRETRQLQEVQ